MWPKKQVAKEIKALTKEEALAFLSAQKISLEELSELVIDSLGDVMAGEYTSKQDEFNIFEQIGAIDGIDEYLRDTLSRDLKRFFASQDPKQQEQVRGAYARSLYWRSMLHRKTPQDPPNKLPQLGSDRYAYGAD